MMIERVNPISPSRFRLGRKRTIDSFSSRAPQTRCDKFAARSRRYFFAVLSLYADLRVPNLDAVIFTVRKRNDEGQRAQQNQNRSDGCGDLQLEIPSSTVSQLIVPPE